MTDTASVTINTGDEGSKGPSLEEQFNSLVAEGLIAADDEGTPNAQGGAAEEAKTDSNDERPDWLPAKFKSVDEFVKAHAELERKLGSGDKPEAQTQEPPANQPTAEERAAAEEATKKAGLDLRTISVEYQKDGKLADETYTKLEAAGYPKEMVDIYIEGLTNRLQATTTAAYDVVGGADGYNEMIDWAITNLDDAEQAAFDTAVNSNNKATALMAIRGLKARMDAAVKADASEEPEEQITKGGKVAANVYETIDDYMADLNDPQYDTNETFRRKVMAKLGRSKVM